MIDGFSNHQVQHNMGVVDLLVLLRNRCGFRWWWWVWIQSLCQIM